jgi:hypothetical protein
MKYMILLVLCGAISAMPFKMMAQSKLRYWSVPAISGIQRLPNVKPDDGTLNGTVDFIAAPGTFEPASIVLNSDENIDNVKLEIGQLRQSSGECLPKSAIDTRVVKVWYQAGTAWFSLRNMLKVRKLTPELLLHDENLVKVNTKNRHNYVRIRPDYWTNISIPRHDKGVKQIGQSIKEFTVKDAAALIPFKLEKGRYKQIWFTLGVPKDAKPGLYSAPISFVHGSQKIGSAQIRVRVLPFHLTAPRTRYAPEREFTSSIYYKGVISNPEKADVSGWFKNTQQLRHDLKNMVEHGVTNPMIHQYEYSYNRELLRKVLKIRQEAGADNKKLYFLGPEKNLQQKTKSDPASLESVKKQVKKIIADCKGFGAEEFYFYGMDEARGDTIRQQKKVWRAIQSAGGKVYVAGCMAIEPNPFKMAGDVLNILINHGHTEKRYADLWHSKGNKIWSYSNPQVGIENPLIYRRNYGLDLWSKDYDGACTFILHQGYGHAWNDFDHYRYRDFNFTYPTMDGSIDTIAWEGYREGIDDIRYASTLKVKALEVLADQKKKSLHKRARNDLKWIDNLDCKNANLQFLRLQIIQRILKLMGNAK